MQTKVLIGLEHYIYAQLYFQKTRNKEGLFSITFICYWFVKLVLLMKVCQNSIKWLCLYIFFLFSHRKDKYSTNLTKNDESIDGLLGSWTRGSRIRGAVKSTELWRHPINSFFNMLFVIFCRWSLARSTPTAPRTTAVAVATAARCSTTRSSWIYLAFHTWVVK